MDVAQATIIVLGRWIRLAEDFYAAGVKFRQALPGDLWNDDAAGVQAWGGAIAGATGQVTALGESANSTADALANYKSRADELFGATMGMVDATLNYEASVDELTASLAANRGAWDAGTAAGRAHIAATKDNIEAAYRVRQAMIDSGQSVAAADAWFRRAADSALAQARANGADAATIGMLTSAWRNYLSLPSVKVITTKFVTEGTAPRAATLGKQYAFAEGGVYEAGQPRMVGEEGPEIDIPAVGGRVLSHADSMRAIANGGGGRALTGGGGGAPAVELSVAPGGDTAVAGLIRNLVRTGVLQLRVGGARVTPA
jgi:hypothetical protein